MTGRKKTDANKPSAEGHPQELQELREAIAAVDRQLLPLLESRFRLMRRVGHCKAAAGKPVYDRHQEMQVLRRVKEGCAAEHAAALEGIWQNLFCQSRAIQYRAVAESGKPSRFMHRMQQTPDAPPQVRRAAFVGGSGALAEQVLQERFPQATRLPCPSFRSAFQKLTEEEVDTVLLPLEDSVTGSFREVYYLLVESGAFILQGFEKRLPYRLLVRAGMKWSDVQTVVAHPKVLLDCARLIQNMGWNRMEEQSSMAAARLVAQHAEGPIAAIGTDYEARMCGLECLPANLPMEQAHALRYILVRREFCRLPGWNRAVFSLLLPNQPAALAYLAEVIASGGLNVRKLRTHEVEDAPWNQMVMLEVDIREGQEADLAQVLNMLQQENTQFRLLGLFPQEAAET